MPLISNCETGKQPERAFEQVKAVHLQGMVPDIITYNALIGTCQKGKQPERALELFQAMQCQRAVPNSIS